MIMHDHDHDHACHHPFYVATKLPPTFKFFSQLEMVCFLEFGYFVFEKKIKKLTEHPFY